MSKLYYYLEDRDQKGPYTIEELSGFTIKPETLIWTDNLENWKEARELNELNNIIRKTPPPLPPLPPLTNDPEKPTKIDKKELIVVDSNIKFWVTLKIYFVIILTLIITCSIGYGFLEMKKNNLKKEIIEKINKVFDGKSVILDGERFFEEGELKETNFDPTKPKQQKYNGKLGELSEYLKNHEAEFDSIKKTQQKNKSKVSKLPDFIEIDNKNWWEKEKIYTIFSLKNGGFTLKKATKLSDESYDIETTYAGDIGFTTPTFYYVPPKYDSWENRYIKGHLSTNYRNDIKSYYKETFDHFTIKDKTGEYAPGKYFDINNLTNNRNEYYYMSNMDPTKYFNNTSYNAIAWSSYEHTNNLQWEEAKVYYDIRGKHYELILDTYNYEKELYQILGVIVGIVISFCLVFWLSKPKFFRNLYLFGKRWKCYNDEDQILFFTFSFLKTHKFTELINNKVLKGYFNFTNKGNTISLTYSQKEHFYKIDKIDADELFLTSLIDGKTIKFIRIGAKLKAEKKSTPNNLVANKL